ncbi:ABC transporter permease [Microscilla marina]|uniref:ABC transporter, permease protein, putative n=1 Tax=Microscilla marina ATCC 23134 TaxID=313606 RepID=A1ZWU9_MICM2|nr:ABC transporter permease [Microscilla marina]EAY25126.1 ABC transporter, permease protein, putative [Microscilla marina ATCC 23134]
MLKNYLVIAMRNMLRHKFYSLLNILGLAIGLNAFLVIMLYLNDEKNYDRFNKDIDQIFRVTQTNMWDKDSPLYLDAVGPAVAPTIRTEIPEVEEVCRVHSDGDYLGVYKDKQTNNLISFDEKKILITEANFLKVFSYPLKEGDPDKILHKPNLVVISQATARRYFGDKPALGKTIRLTKGKYDQLFEVSGVIDNKQGQSHMDFDMLVSMSSFNTIRKREWIWIWTTFVTYIKVKKQASLAELQQKLKVLPEKHAEASIKRIYGQSYKDFIGEYKPWYLQAQPLGDVYLQSTYAGNRLGAQGDIRYYYVFLAVGILIIVLSCINFMNLATARATQRAKEVGIRKVLGSERSLLVWQFLGEAFIFTLLATVLALVATEVGLGFFNQLTGRELSIMVLLQPTFLLSVILLPIVIALFAGGYPAFYMTRFTPADALKGKMNSGREGRSLRNGLVVLQFSISCVLMISSLVLFQQLKYWQTKKLGFDHKQLVVVPKVERLGNQLETFQQKLLQHTGIEQAGWSDASPPNIWMQDHLKAAEKNAIKIPVNIINTHADYLKALSLSVLEGRLFSRQFSKDTSHVIMNETAVKAMGWKVHQAVGKKLVYGGDANYFYKVIGVVKDFNFTSLQQNIEPLAFFHLGANLYAGTHRHLTFRVNNSADVSQVLSYAEGVWKLLAKDLPFEFQFMDGLFRRAYQAEQRASDILMIFTGLALFIAALGLIGLATFSAERRTKEVGVRKVLGASTLQIFTLLSKEYAKLILLALLIAVPLAYLMMDRWLQDFTYRVTIDWRNFLWTAIVALLVAGVAVVYQSVRAAFVNPVESLRDE